VSDHTGLSPEAVGPNAVGEDDRQGPAGAVVGPLETVSQGRSGAQQLEGARRDVHAIQAIFDALSLTKAAHMRTTFPLFVVAAFVMGCVGEAAAQPLGIFRWQLSPYCNVLTLLPTANGPVYRLEGFDDQCGGARAAVIGMAVVNANGTIGFGLTVVTAPGAAPLHVDVSLNLAG
jgi:hypothetical protein